MCRCDYCFYRYECIGFFPSYDGRCAGFLVDPILEDLYLKEFEVKNNVSSGSSAD